VNALHARLTPEAVLAWPVPSGRAHNTINTLAYLGLVGVAGAGSAGGWLALEAGPALAFSLAYFAGTFLLSPDLDLAEGRVASKRAWGWLGFLWKPYGWLMRHRGLSHTWLVGPLTRLAYLGLLLALPAWLLREPLSRLDLPGSWVPAALAGYYLSQWLHLVADGLRPDLEAGTLRLGRRGR
jgi:uncharacterized metal-binding protein